MWGNFLEFYFLINSCTFMIWLHILDLDLMPEIFLRRWCSGDCTSAFLPSGVKTLTLRTTFPLLVPHILNSRNRFYHLVNWVISDENKSKYGVPKLLADLFVNSNFHALIVMTVFNVDHRLPEPSFQKSWCYLIGRDHHYAEESSSSLWMGDSWVLCGFFAVMKFFHRNLGSWGQLCTAINEKKSLCFLIKEQFKK